MTVRRRPESIGKPVARGTRITVDTILRTLSSGGPIEQVFEAHPRLTPADGLRHACMAHELGFCSQSHFTRIFRAHIGITPALYRAQFGRAAH